MPSSRKTLNTIRALSRHGIRLLIAACLAAAVLLSASPFYIYSRFTQEKPVAELSFRQIGPRHYIAYLATGNFCTVRSYPLYGDQWRIDAAFLKWTNLGTMLGLDSRYRLDRLSGRYSTVSEENALPHQAHDLAPDVVFDIFRLGRIGVPWGSQKVVNQRSSAYMDIDVTRRYVVYRSQSGLVARSEPLPKTETKGGRLTIRISRACGRQPGWLESVSRQINDTVLRWWSALGHAT